MKTNNKLRFDNIKPLIIDCELGINFVTHLYTLANAGFTDECYYNKFQHLIPSEDIKFLQDHASLLAFDRRDHGKFAYSLFFVPAGLNFQKKSTYEEYFAAWDQAVNSKNANYLAPYSTDFGSFDSLCDVTKEEWEQIVLSQWIFKRIGEIYCSHFDIYKNNIWPEIKEILSTRSHELLKVVPENLICKWESITKKNFICDKYSFLLYYAGAQGPSFNNLSRSKNSAFYALNTDYLIDMISHEIGIFTIQPYIWEDLHLFEEGNYTVNKAGTYRNVSYIAFESMASFYNELLLGRKTNCAKSSNDYSAFKEIYQDLYHQGYSVEGMYKQGVLSYIQMHSI